MNTPVQLIEVFPIETLSVYILSLPPPSVRYRDNLISNPTQSADFIRCYDVLLHLLCWDLVTILAGKPQDERLCPLASGF
jgi:hypothetical protein